MAGRQRAVKKKVAGTYVGTSDTELAEAFLKACKRSRIAWLVESDTKGYWLVWTSDKRWERDHGPKVRNAIDTWLSELPERYHRFRTQPYLRRIESRLADLTATDPKEFNAESNMLALRNYVVNVDTGEYYDHDPSYLISRQLDVNYEQYIPGDWSNFVTELFQHRGLCVSAQKLIGYSLFRSGNPENLFIVIKGPSGTGKGTFIETIHNVFAHMTKAVRLSIFREKQSESARSDIVAAMTTRLAFNNETSSAWELHADAIKRFTGYESMSSREIYGKEFDAKPECTPIVVTNHAPQIKGNDKAMRRRLLCLPVSAPKKPRKNEVGLSDRLARECSSEVFMWALRGYWKYLEDGLDDVRALTERATERLFQEMSPVADFIARRTIELEGHTELQSDIYTAYVAYSEELPDRRTFGVELSSLGWEKARQGHGGQRARIGRKLR